MLCCVQVYLWRVAESVVRLTRPLMRDHVRIVNCISKDMPPVKGDSARLMQVRQQADDSAGLLGGVLLAWGDWFPVQSTCNGYPTKDFQWGRCRGHLAAGSKDCI
jgi:hypothetical protein